MVLNRENLIAKEKSKPDIIAGSMGKPKSWSAYIRYPKGLDPADPPSTSHNISGQQCIYSILNSIAGFIEAFESFSRPSSSSKLSAQQIQEQHKFFESIVVSANSVTDIFNAAKSSEKLDHYGRIELQRMSASEFQSSTSPRPLMIEARPFRLQLMSIRRQGAKLLDCRRRIVHQMVEYEHKLKRRFLWHQSTLDVYLKEIEHTVEDLLSQARYELGCWLHHNWGHAFDQPEEWKGNQAEASSGSEQPQSPEEDGGDDVRREPPVLVIPLDTDTTHQGGIALQAIEIPGEGAKTPKRRLCRCKLICW
ncbi:hypothetical protein V8F20_009402 [Naviculisporaceae sp. PSN 640]